MSRPITPLPIQHPLGWLLHILPDCSSHYEGMLGCRNSLDRLTQTLHTANDVWTRLVVHHIGLSKRHAPIVLWAITEDPIDSAYGRTKGSDAVKDIACLNQEERMAYYRAAKQLCSARGIDVIPNFLDELITLLWPSYVIAGTYKAHQECIGIFKEMKLLERGSKPNNISILASRLCYIVVGALMWHDRLYEMVFRLCSALGEVGCLAMYDLLLCSAAHGNDQLLGVWVDSVLDMYLQCPSTCIAALHTLFRPCQVLDASHRAGLHYTESTQSAWACYDCSVAISDHLSHCKNTATRLGLVDPQGSFTPAVLMCMCSDTQLTRHMTTYGCADIFKKCLPAVRHISNSYRPIMACFRLKTIRDRPAVLANYLQGGGLYSHNGNMENIGVGNNITMHVAGSILNNSFPGVSMKRGINGVCVRVYPVKKTSYYKALDRLYPPSSAVDGKHMTLKLSHLVSRAISTGWHAIFSQALFGRIPDTQGQLKIPSKTAIVKMINSVLSNAPVGTCQNVLIHLILLRFQQDSSVDKHVDTLIHNGLFRMDFKSQHTYLKHVSVLLRRYNLDVRGVKVVDDVVRLLAYLELSYGRSVWLSDQQAEVNNRCYYTHHLHMPNMKHQNVGTRDMPNLSSDKYWRTEATAYKSEDPEFYNALERELTSIMKTIMPTKGVSVTYNDFLCRANEWLASGSAPGATVQIPSPDLEGATVKAKVGKRGWAEQLNPATFSRYIYTSVPEEVAVASEKCENGKGRALYGVEPKHYMHSTYATKGLEERLHLQDGLEKGLSGQEALQREVLRSKITQDSSQHCMMVDYADFNVQHTPTAQQLVFEVIAKVGATRGACRDFVRANEWVAESKSNMRCRFSPRDLPSCSVRSKRDYCNYKVKKSFTTRVQQGMFSGTRSTDLINTLLNLCYFRIAKKAADELCGKAPSELYHVHQGDDVWISTNEPVWCASLYYALNSMGLVMQSSKQMFGQGRGEYLRVLYSNGIAGGYLGRAIANAVTKEIQRPLPLDAMANIATAMTSLSTCCRRGMSRLALSMLWYDKVDHLSKIQAFPGDPNPVTVPRNILCRPVNEGGLGMVLLSDNNLTDFGNRIARGPGQATLQPTMPCPRMPERLDPAALPSQCTTEWISLVSKKLHRFGDVSSGRLKQSSVCSNHSDAIFTVWKRSIMRKYKADMAGYITAANARSSKYRFNLTSGPSVMPVVDCANRPGMLSYHSNEAGYTWDDLLSGRGTNVWNDMPMPKPHFSMPQCRDAIWANLTGIGKHKGVVQQELTHQVAHKVVQNRAETLVPNNLLESRAQQGIDMCANKQVKSLKTESSLFNSIVVRSSMKSLSRLRSALDLSAREAFILLLTQDNFASSQNAEIISKWISLVNRGHEYIVRLLEQPEGGTLGFASFRLQPSILSGTAAISVDTLINQVLPHTAVLPVNEVLTTLYLTQACAIARAVRTLTAARLQISY